MKMNGKLAKINSLYDITNILKQNDFKEIDSNHFVKSYDDIVYENYEIRNVYQDNKWICLVEVQQRKPDGVCITGNFTFNSKNLNLLLEEANKAYRKYVKYVKRTFRPNKNGVTDDLAGKIMPYNIENYWERHNNIAVPLLTKYKNFLELANDYTYFKNACEKALYISNNSNIIKHYVSAQVGNNNLYFEAYLDEKEFIKHGVKPQNNTFIFPACIDKKDTANYYEVLRLIYLMSGELPLKNRLDEIYLTSGRKGKYSRYDCLTVQIYFNKQRDKYKKIQNDISYTERYNNTPELMKRLSGKHRIDRQTIMEINRKGGGAYNTAIKYTVKHFRNFPKGQCVKMIKDSRYRV